eukprot:711308-Hanusia_phi.AAC.2
MGAHDDAAISASASASAILRAILISTMTREFVVNHLPRILPGRSARTHPHPDQQLFYVAMQRATAGF